MATGRIGTTPVLQVRWSKAPSDGTTSLSGLDDNSVSLVYSVGYEAVYRNGVLLSRGNDYTATDGTTVTLIDATITGDIIEIFANQTIPLSDTYSQTVSDGKFINNTLTTTTGDIIYASGANTPARLAIGTSADVLTVSGGIPAWAAPASSSGPAFRAYRATTDQSISRQTNTKVQFNGETFDTASCFDSTTNYRFTPNVAGYYQYNWRVNIGGLTGTQLTELQLNGTRTGRGSMSGQDGVYNYGVSVGSDILYMNGTTDYVEVYVYVEQASGTVFINEDANGADTAFSGVWIRS
jgi:hypothetical protein